MAIGISEVKNYLRWLCPNGVNETTFIIGIWPLPGWGLHGKTIELVLGLCENYF